MRASEVTAEWFEDNLEGLEWTDKKKTTGIAWCPVHDDEGTSMKGLSITWDERRGIFLTFCHSCQARLPDVIAARNGNSEDIKVNVRKRSKSEDSKDKTQRRQKTKSSGGMAWWVEYTGVPRKVWERLGTEEFEDGVAFIFDGIDTIKVRKPPKEIMWLPKGGVNPPLWPIPPHKCDEHVFVGEGESDTGTAAMIFNQAFTVTKGAGTKMPTLWAETLKDRGVREVTISGDADESGQEMRKELEKQAVDAGLRVNILHPELALDPFSGENDLNALWHHCEHKLARFKAEVERCTQKVSSRYRVYTAVDADEDEDDVPWLVPDLVAPGDKILISGPQKSYKTWVALDLARSFVSCAPFLKRGEWTPENPLKVLFCQEEGGWPKWKKRIRRLGLTPKQKERFFTLHRRGIRFTEPDTIDTVISICREHEIDVLFFDPMQRMIPGIDENDSSATGVVWDEVFRIQYALPHLVVIILHHANKTERLTWESVRGSSRHAGEVDLGVFCQKTDRGEMKIAVDGRDIPGVESEEAFEGQVHISADDEKDEFYIDAQEVHVQVNQVTRQAGKNKDAVLIAVVEGCTTKTSIVSQTEMSENTVVKYLKELVEEGKIIETDNGPGRAKTYGEGE